MYSKLSTLNFNIQEEKNKVIIDKLTVIVGIDVGKTNQYARCIDSVTKKELGKKIIFSRTRKGIDEFVNYLMEIKMKYNKTNVIIGLEPTGIYGEAMVEMLSLFEFIDCVYVDVNHVKKVRDLYYSASAKNDLIDSIAIARTVLEKADDNGKIKIVEKKRVLTKEEKNLRDTSKCRESIIKNTLQIENGIITILDKICPEYKSVYSTYCCKSSLLLLETVFCLEGVLSKSNEQIYKEIKQKSATCVGMKKIEQLRCILTNGLKIEPTNADIMDLQVKLAHLKLYKKQLIDVENYMIELVKDNEVYKNMIEIKGIGEVSAANILAELVDFNKFSSYKKLLNYCGFNLRMNQSGAKKGKTMISKKGNATLRCYLFRVILPVLRFNPEFKRLHEYYTTRKENPLKKMQSLIALCCKLLKILYGMAKSHTKYNPQKCFSDIDLMSESAA